MTRRPPMETRSPAADPRRLPAPDWRALERRTREPAPAATCAWLSAAAHLPADQRPAPLSVKENGALLAVAGMRAPGRFWAAGRVISTRWSPFFFSGLPLLRAGREEEALRGLLRSAAGRGAAMAEFAAVPASGPFMAALEAVAKKDGLPLRRMAEWRRAALDADREPEEWWRRDIPRRRRKEWTRLMRRLRESGDVAFEIRRPGAALAPWLEDFFALEASGWKGRAGTALACDPALRRFVEEALRALDAAGNLRFWRLRRDGRTIAALFAIVRADRLWLGKTAYAEELAHFSPGVLLMIEATRDILADPAIRLADSCADPDHPMIDHLWRQRLPLADVLIALPGARRGGARMLFRLEGARRAARAALKRLWKTARRNLLRARKRAA